MSLIAVAIISAAGGFLAGLFCYSHVYAHFHDSLQKQFATRAAAERHRAVVDRAMIEHTKQRLIQEWGQDLSARHKEILDEELASAITKPRGGGNV